MRKKVEFQSHGISLVGTLEMPASQVSSYAIFAHCFTCGKDIAAASRIARALTAKGIAVLRFDFTGLGNSDGDFANTNFSSNIQDLLSAANFLAKDFAAPELLIGHSLGGAAVLAMAGQLPSVKAIVTIGAPFQAGHVMHNFAASVDDIRRDGAAEVTLGLRKFTIKKQFLDDLEAYSEQDISHLNKALLVCHSPLDTTVDISEAEKIYRAAKHPKSFVSLDKADHLLTKREDSSYVAEVIAGWVGRYLSLTPAEDHKRDTSPGQVVVTEKNHKFTLHVSTDSHYWLADEPIKVGGDNMGPDPYEHLLAALGACTVMTLRMYANHKSIALENIVVTLRHEHDHIKDCEEPDNDGAKIEVIHREIELIGDIDEVERSRLLQIADRCPVHKTLLGTLQVRTDLVESG
tara:strand:- start:38628 stop:39842 length:1215 start_codon:yes stop_codon:yes gene_type:complete